MIIYTDGSAHPNPGPGGYGVVILDNNKNYITHFSRQYEGPVTNNEMELKAILFSLLTYGKEEDIIVYSDSSYAVNTFNTWMYNWAKNGWIKSDKKTPENLELIQTYYDLVVNKGYKINLCKVKGHSTDKWNVFADKLATGKMN